MTVIGMGNPEMSDDGIGVRIAELLREEIDNGEWQANVSVVAVGSDAALAAACIADGDDVLLVDAMDIKSEPGEWRLFTPAEAVFHDSTASGSSHSLSLDQVLSMARALGTGGALRIMGIQFDSVRPGRSLSERVQSRLPQILRRIREEVRRLS